ncbi:MAG: cytochrome c biogenesis protein CcsA [Phycisphaerae bacterium]
MFARLNANQCFAAVFTIAIASQLAAAERTPMPPSTATIELDRALDWKQARLISVQDNGRYKTLDSFAREAMTTMYGREHFPGCSPLASLFDWLFRSNAYADEPVVYIRDKGLRIHFSAHMPATERERIVRTGYLAFRQSFDQAVRARLQELETRTNMATATGRARNAFDVAEFLPRMIRIVPPQERDVDAPWYEPEELKANLPTTFGISDRAPVPGISDEQATNVLARWYSLRDGWRAGDAPKVQAALDGLAATLPTLAAPGVYPSAQQRQAEARYYTMGKFTWGWVFYFLGALASVMALVTNWRTPRVIGIALLVLALALHAYGISLRWYILGRIPVANMFEAIVGSAWIGIAAALVAELVYKTRVFLVAANLAGFVALILGGFVIPGGGTLTSIMGILDDVMLRIHTVLIIASYALIFIAAVIALVYLFGYYNIRFPQQSLTSGLVVASLGVALWLTIGLFFEPSTQIAGTIVKRGGAQAILWWLTAGAGVVLTLLIWLRARGLAITICSAVFLTVALAAVGNFPFLTGTAVTLTATGLLWSVAQASALLRRHLPVAKESLVLAGAGGPSVSLRQERPIMAGGAPGDEAQGKKLPEWLHAADWSHLIILNLVFVMLFVGIILGAVWADYSWGRPWGWDPKEVFAMNTWIIYAVLIHARFIVRERGIWTAWLSIAGCLMMAFNWCFVNFFIVGLHSYA